MSLGFQHRPLGLFLFCCCYFLRGSRCKLCFLAVGCWLCKRLDLGHYGCRLSGIWTLLFLKGDLQIVRFRV